MIMRYHWGLGVGHVYSHDNSASNPHKVPEVNKQPGRDDNDALSDDDLALAATADDCDHDGSGRNVSSSVPAADTIDDTNDPDYDSELDCDWNWDDHISDDSEDGSGSDWDDLDDDELVDYDDMFGGALDIELSSYD